MKTSLHIVFGSGGPHFTVVYFWIVWHGVVGFLLAKEEHIYMEQTLHNFYDLAGISLQIFQSKIQCHNH